MSTLRVIASRLRALVLKRHRDAELDDEIQAHLDLFAEERVREGMSIAAARAAARRAFGGVEPIKQAYRDQRGWPFIDTLAQDVRSRFER